MYKLILLCFFVPALLAYHNVQGNWKTHSARFTNSCPVNFEDSLAFLNINTKNVTDGSTDFLLYYNDDSSTFSNCTIKSSSVSCGTLSNRYQCNRDAGLFLNYSSALVNVTIDFNTNVQTLSIDFDWSDKDTIRTCSYTGPKSTLNLPDSAYTVENCSCVACCYKPGSTIRVSELPNSRNRPVVKVEGTLVGDYCENTLVETDFCQATDTTTKIYDGQVVKVSNTKCNETSCGVQTIMWGDDVSFNNRSGNYLVFSWANKCNMFASTGWGERIGLALIGIFAIFMAY